MTQTTMGHYLWQRLKQMGIRYVFGVPGDFNLQLLEQLSEVDGIEFVGTCNELNAAYAADGYARSNGIAALITTYGVGDLSALCGVAGSFAEHIPVVMISGVPPMYAIRNRLQLHHTMAEGNFDNVRTALKQFTLTDACLTPANASQEIDRALNYCWQERCPVYLQVPSNLSYLEIKTNDVPITRAPAGFDSRQQQSAMGAIQAKFAKAKRPVMLIDMDAERAQISDQLQQLADRYNIPYASFLTGKAILDETSPLWLGYYPASAESSLSQWLNQADLILATAPCYQEGSPIAVGLPTEQTIYLQGFEVTIAGDVYEGVNAQVLLDSMLEQGLTCTHRSDHPKPPSRRGATYQAQQPLRHEQLWPQIGQYFRGTDIVIGENGCANIALQTLPFPKGCHYIAQPIWGSIGFTLPALLGSMLAQPSKRHWLFIGDGSFQMTAQELSTLLQRGLKPVIVLLNNAGYTIERYIFGKQARYNDIAQWNYQALLDALAPNIRVNYQKVNTHEELAQTLDALTNEQATFIEIQLDPLDAPARLQQFGASFAEFDYGPRGPQHPKKTT
ncbi:alpha-keto acid decarboxylase family protein [Celerinatantimonas yamalensis]|uniref:Thiamine pyrophosphate-binding protein n=1 Tax=Celerinatantimonas yamalensis TaxID=559956 RepID=A0ABW9G7X9_9GAMM